MPLDVPLPTGGYFVLEATAHDGTPAAIAVTRTSFYALGDGYTAWARYDHNRIDLVPERTTYKPGDTARIMIQSPWEQATALVTTEREGIRTHRQFALTSTQQSISVPITESDIPNVFVSVLLVKGRTTAPPSTSTAGAHGPSAATQRRQRSRQAVVPARLRRAEGRGRVEAADGRRAREQGRVPAGERRHGDARREGCGRAAARASEVTLWAVDYGVLSLTAYRTPDVLGSVYVHKALQVLNADNRQRIISRRVLTPKGETDGGGGGRADAGRDRCARTSACSRSGSARSRPTRTAAADGRREAARVADDLPHHGGRRRTAARASGRATPRSASTSR